MAVLAGRGGGGVVSSPAAPPASPASPLTKPDTGFLLVGTAGPMAEPVVTLLLAGGEGTGFPFVSTVPVDADETDLSSWLLTCGTELVEEPVLIEARAEGFVGLGGGRFVT